MPARTGREYLEGLRAQDREVWLDGERIRDVTAHPGLRGGARRRSPRCTTCSTTPGSATK